MQKRHVLFLRTVIVVGLAAALLVGCSGRATIRMEVPLESGLVLPAAGAKDWDGYDKWDGMNIPLSPACGVSVIAALNRGDYSALDLGNDVPFYISMLLRRTSLRSITARSIVLTARQGNFSSLAKAGLEIRLPDGGVALVSAERAGPFDTQVVMRPQQSRNLLSSLTDGDVDCLNPYLILEGSLPQERVVFDAVLYVNVEVRLRLI